MTKVTWECARRHIEPFLMGIACTQRLLVLPNMYVLLTFDCAAFPEDLGDPEKICPSRPGRPGLQEFDKRGPGQSRLSAGLSRKNQDTYLEFAQDEPLRAPYPGHSVYLQPFFVCSVKRVGETPRIGQIYLEVAVDGNCGLAFAKVYPAESPINAIDILEDCVVPFFKKHGVAIERAITPKRRSYCGLSFAHPFKFFLSCAGISHEVADTEDGIAPSPWGGLYKKLLNEVFTRELRESYDVSYIKLQQKLDTFVHAYNYDLPESSQTPLKLSPYKSFMKAISVEEFPAARGHIDRL